MTGVVDTHRSGSLAAVDMAPSLTPEAFGMDSPSRDDSFSGFPFADACMTRHPRDYTTDLGLLALTLVWGVNFSVVKLLLAQLDPLALNALRFPMAALVVGLLIRRLPPKPLRREHRLRLILLGLLGNVAYQVSFIIGIDHTLAGNASLLLATSPVWTVLLSALVGHEHPTRWVVIGSTSTLAGMVFVVLGRGEAVSLGTGTLLGDGLMVTAAVLWAAFTVGSARVVREYGSIRVTAWTLWIGTPMLVLIGLPSMASTEWRALTVWSWAGIIYAGVFSIGVAYMLWYRGVQRLGNSRTAVYSNLVPVAALITAWVWLGEVPTATQLIGAAVILGGLWLTRWGGGAPRQTSFGRRDPGGSEQSSSAPRSSANPPSVGHRGPDSPGGFEMAAGLGVVHGCEPAPNTGAATPGW